MRPRCRLQTDEICDMSPLQTPEHTFQLVALVSKGLNRPGLIVVLRQGTSRSGQCEPAHPRSSQHPRRAIWYCSRRRDVLGSSAQVGHISIVCFLAPDWLRGEDHRCQSGASSLQSPNIESQIAWRMPPPPSPPPPSPLPPCQGSLSPPHTSPP